MSASTASHDLVDEASANDLEGLASQLASHHSIGAKATELPVAVSSLGQVRKYLRELRPHFDSTENDAPVAPWFLDNDYLIQRTAGQVVQDLDASSYARLPCLDSGEARVCSIADHIVAATQLKIDEGSIDQFLSGYQDVSALGMSELWVLPAMLRLCLLEELLGALARFAPAVEAPAWIARKATAPGFDDYERFRRCLGSLRIVDSIQWKDVYVRASVVEEILSEDPVDKFLSMDFESADMYRHAVAEISWRSKVGETEVARRAIYMASQAAELDERARHVGFYLVDSGRKDLESSLGYTPDLTGRFRRWVLRNPTLAYVGGVGVATAAFWALPLAYLFSLQTNWLAWLVAAPTSLLLASTLGVTAVQWTLTRFLSPRVIPKLDFSDGIPDEFRSIVAIPTLIGNQKDVLDLVRQIEIHYLSNPDPNLCFVILADYHDAEQQHMPGDAELLRQAQVGVTLLNDKYDDRSSGLFHVLVRSRRWNPMQDCWMGWERKRGKLEEFNALLAGAGDTSYTTHFGNSASLVGARFVITLDTDTSLPPGSAARLVGTLAHPLNRAQFDLESGRVTAGYTVIQPRTEISPQSANRSIFTRAYAGDTSIDIYSRAVSDVYQDLFGEGSFIGKGIYDPVSFQRAVASRVPENAILSHDLFEGIHGRVGLCTDIVLYEDYPPHYLAFSRRMHRWIRGDWQLLPWLRKRVPSASGDLVPNRLRLIDRWKIFDNLRRSLVGPAILLFLIAAWTFLPGAPVLWTLLALIAPAGHIAAELFTNFAGVRRHAQTARSVADALRRQRENLYRWFLFVAFMPHEALTTVGAIGRTLVRMHVTHRRMLDWSTAAQTALAIRAHGRHSLVWAEMIGGPVVALGLLLCIPMLQPEALWVAGPLLGLWFASPEIARFISASIARKNEALSESDTAVLRALARRTWLFFETFVGPEDNWLPPDNFQEAPRGEVAHRTSPTNIGMMLMSTLSAYDFGYVGVASLTFRLRGTLDSLGRMTHHQGHLLNWYDTRTLDPLEPRYVSTVDSGNLAASLITLKQGCAEAAANFVLRKEQCEGLLDTILLLETTVESASSIADSDAWVSLRRALSATQSQLHRRFTNLREWFECIERLKEKHCPDLDASLMEALEGKRSALDLDLMRDLHDSLEHGG